MAEAPRLQAEGLCSGYGRVPVLEGVCLHLQAGEIVAVLGHNGMGKSTLMKTLVGLLRATSGRICMDDCDVTREPAHLRARRGLGYVPQGRHIFPFLTVRENLLMGAAASGRKAEQSLQELLVRFPVLARLLERQGGVLSGGEQQILALARALARGPGVLLLDEPTEGVQPSAVEKMQEHLARLRSESGLAIMIVEQDLDFVAGLADRVLLIQKGRIMRSVSPSELRDPHILDEFAGFAA